MSIFNPQIPKSTINDTLKRGQKRCYKNILNMEQITSISLKSLDKQINEITKDEQKFIREEFQAAVKEARRNAKAKNASKKHSNKLNNEFVSLEIDIRKLKFERNALKAEIEGLETEIRKWDFGRIWINLTNFENV